MYYSIIKYSHHALHDIPKIIYFIIGNWYLFFFDVNHFKVFIEFVTILLPVFFFFFPLE